MESPSDPHPVKILSRAGWSSSKCDSPPNPPPHCGSKKSLLVRMAWDMAPFRIRTKHHIAAGIKMAIGHFLAHHVRRKLRWHGQTAVRAFAIRDDVLFPRSKRH